MAKEPVRDDEWGTPALTKKYLKATPGQDLPKLKSKLKTFKSLIEQIDK